MSFKPLTSYAWDNPVGLAAISPDGKYLAFCSKGKLFVQVIRTGEKHSLALPEGFYLTEVVWFPDGTKLLLSRIQERWIQGERSDDVGSRIFSIWSLSMLGGTPQKIVDMQTVYASVSPDGSLVAFHRFDPDRQASEIWLVGSNGEGPRKLEIAAQPGRQLAQESILRGPVWSPNGKRLLYLRIDGQRGRSIESCDLRGEQVTTIFSSQQTDVRSPLLDYRWKSHFSSLDKKELDGSCGLLSIFGRSRSMRQPANPWVRLDALPSGLAALAFDCRQLEYYCRREASW